MAVRARFLKRSPSQSDAVSLPLLAGTHERVSAMPGRTPHSYGAVFTCPTANTVDSEDCSVLTELVNCIAPGWSVEMDRNPTGEVNVMIIPPNGDDAAGPTLVIYKAASVFHLDQVRWDEYHSLGDYINLDDVSDAVSDLLLSQPMMAGPSITLH